MKGAKEDVVEITYHQVQDVTNQHFVIIQSES